MSDLTGQETISICQGLRQSDDREAIARALTEVAAMPCSPEGLTLRLYLANEGGLDLIASTLLSTHGDVRQQCKAANALGSLCMADDVSRAFGSNPKASAVLDRLGDMLRSRSQWAQGDAVGCLGWLVYSMSRATLHELVPVVTRLMTKHLDTDDDVFVREEREKGTRATWGRDVRKHNGQNGSDERRHPRWRRKMVVDDSASAVRERLDNIRVYSLIFLLKAALADASTVSAMVDEGCIPVLLRHLLSQAREASSPRRLARDANEAPRAIEPDQSCAGSEDAPSTLLAARLIYAFSTQPGVRTSLLQSKCLPPLIRLRQSFQHSRSDELHGARGVTCSGDRHPRSSPQSRSGTTRDYCRGKDLQGGEAVTGDKQRVDISEALKPRHEGLRSGMQAQDLQPSLYETVSLVIDELVGKKLGRA